MVILTEKERMQIWDNCAQTGSSQNIANNYAVAIESAVLAKAGEQQVIAYYDLYMPNNIRWVSGGFICTVKQGDPIYARPLPALPDGYATAPLEPTDAMIDAGVALALQVSVHGQDGWGKYITGLYKQMIAARPKF